MRLLAGLLLLVSFSASADVTVTVSSYTAATGQASITIAGDPLLVEIAPQGGGSGIDVCVPGASGAMVDDGGLTPSTTLKAGTTVCELMPHAAWPGMKATVNGVTKNLVVGTAVVFGAVTSPPAPPVVQPPTVGTGSATLSWNPPTTNTDGSPLTNLASFKVYWGTSSGIYTSSVTVNPALTSYVVQNLSPATYYFTVTALTASGAESVFSNEASKTIAGTEPAPTPSDPCALRPFTFSVNTWPGGITGSRSLGFSSNKAVDRFDLTRTSTRVTGVKVTDLEGCTVTVTR